MRLIVLLFPVFFGVSCGVSHHSVLGKLEKVKPSIEDMPKLRVHERGETMFQGEYYAQATEDAELSDEVGKIEKITVIHSATQFSQTKRAVVHSVSRGITKDEETHSACSATSDQPVVALSRSSEDWKDNVNWEIFWTVLALSVVGIALLIIAITNPPLLLVLWGIAQVIIAIATIVLVIVLIVLFFRWLFSY